MAYTAKDFECPDKTKKGFLPGASSEAERLVLTMFRAAWLANNLSRPYVSLGAHVEAERLGYIRFVAHPSTYRLTEQALEALHRVYGR